MAKQKKNRIDYLDEEEMTVFRLTVRSPDNDVYDVEQSGFGFNLNECKQDAKSAFMHSFPKHQILKINPIDTGKKDRKWR